MAQQSNRVYTKADVERFRKFTDVTPNGVVFDWELASIDGAWFCLIREPHHTDADIAEAERYLRSQRDVVKLVVGRLQEEKAC